MGLSKATFLPSKSTEDFFALLRRAKRLEWEVIATQMPAKGVVIAADDIDTNVGSIREQLAPEFQALFSDVQLEASDLPLLLGCRPDIKGALSLTFCTPDGLPEHFNRLVALLRAAGAATISELLPSIQSM
jgi:hypothetical protein